MATNTARDIMTPDPVTVPPHMPVKDAAKLMVDNKVGALPVLENDKLVGLVTEGDLIMADVKVEFPTYIDLLSGFIFYPPSIRRFENEIKKHVGAEVCDVMTHEPITVAAGATVEDVATLMIDRDVSRVPVLDGDKLVGIVSKSDIVRSIASEE
jgi:CBS domain-containing protein